MLEKVSKSKITLMLDLANLSKYKLMINKTNKIKSSFLQFYLLLDRKLKINFSSSHYYYIKCNF